MIIHSLLDTDLYKFTMMQVVLHQFPGAQVEYHFKCRNADVDLRPYAEEIRHEISQLCQLRFSEDELEYLRSFSFFKDDFVDFLRIFKLSERYVEIRTDEEFDVIIRGPWLHTIMFEVPVLAIISEIYYRANAGHDDLKQGEKLLDEKIKFIKNAAPSNRFHFSDFGTRRRYSREWHRYVVAHLKSQLPDYLTGTSNVLLAKELDMLPIGTMAHEYLQACQSLGPRLVYSQKFAFEKWAQEYRGELGIALSDVYGMDAFINDFDLYFCKLFDGARHDSGDPILWGEKLLEHYKNMRINAKTKIMVFSDSLTFQSALEIFNHFKDRTNPVFGIGTNLTNDMGRDALQLVIKMTQCNGHPVAKVSDTPGKTMCKDESYLRYLKQVFKLD